MFSGLLIGFAFVILARWRMQIAYVQSGGILDNKQKPEPEMPLGKLVANTIAAVALYFLIWKTTYEVAHLAVLAVFIGLAWQSWKLTKVFKVYSAATVDRMTIYSLLALGVTAIACSMHIGLKGIYGAV